MKANLKCQLRLQLLMIVISFLDDDEYKDENSEGNDSDNNESERIEEFEDIDKISKQIIKKNGLSEDIDLDEALISVYRW